MTKVTITSATDGNEPTSEISARAEATLATARNATPVETLEAIVAEARRFLSEVYEPAHQAFSEADQASIDNKAPEFTERANELNDIWLDHADTFEAIARRIFSLPTPTPEIARRHVVAYAELVTPCNGENLNEEDPIKRLNREDVRLVVDYLLEASTPSRGTPTSTPQPFGGPQGDGYAVSPPLPDASTPLAQAVALRDQLRVEVQAYEDEHDADAPQEYQDRLIAAEFGVYRAPAISAAEILWKLGEHLMEDGEGYTHAEAVAAVENTYGLVAAALAGVYRDLERLTDLEPVAPKYGCDREFMDQTAIALDLCEAGNALIDSGESEAGGRKLEAANKIVSGLLEQRPSTIAGVMARARLLDHHAPADCFEDHSKIEWQIARALIGDVKALFCTRPQTNLYGSEDFSALWTAARLAAYTKGDTYPPPPAMSASPAGATELLAAE